MSVIIGGGVKVLTDRYIHYLLCLFIYLFFTTDVYKFLFIKERHITFSLFIGFKTTSCCLLRYSSSLISFFILFITKHFSFSSILLIRIREAEHGPVNTLLLR